MVIIENMKSIQRNKAAKDVKHQSLFKNLIRLFWPVPCFHAKIYWHTIYFWKQVTPDSPSFRRGCAACKLLCSRVRNKRRHRIQRMDVFGITDAGTREDL